MSAQSDAMKKSQKEETTVDLLLEMGVVTTLDQNNKADTEATIKAAIKPSKDAVKETPNMDEERDVLDLLVAKGVVNPSSSGPSRTVTVTVPASPDESTDNSKPSIPVKSDAKDPDHGASGSAVPRSTLEGDLNAADAVVLDQPSAPSVANPARQNPGAFSVSANGGNESSGDDFHVGMLQPAESLLEPLSTDDSGTQTNSNNDGLVVAEEVMEEGDAAPQDLPRARELRSSEKAEARWKNFIFWGIMAVLCVVALVTFLIIFFVVKSEAKNNSTTLNTSSSATQTVAPKSPEEVLTPLLPSYTIPKLQFEETPQSQAFQFLIQDQKFGTYTEKRLLQRFALAAFYYATQGPRYGGNNTWLKQSQHECQWETFMPTDREYTRGLDFRHSYYKFIDGPCFVPNATHPDRSVNATSATDSDDITCLAMFEQELHGAIPPEIALLTSLKLLHLDATTLVGTIPDVIFQLSSLEELHLMDTLFVDSIPTELMQLTMLKTLQISGDGYSGTLPTELGLLTDMDDLMITDTNITGTLPIDSFVQMQPKDLQMSYNQLSGSLPTELGLLTRVEWIFLDRNKLTGTIPTEIGLMEEASIIYVHYNELHGPLPSELGLMSNLDQIYTIANMLTGSLPTEVGAIENLWRFVVKGNFVTGTIPSEYGSFKRLHNLALNENAITGTIPTEVAALSSMQWLSLQDNQLSGSLPEEFGNVTRLKRMLLYENQLSGSLPSWLGSLTRMLGLDVNSNSLVGRIPSELGLLTSSLKTFHAGNNALSGFIPAELELLVTNGTLSVLNLTFNALSGTVPEKLCVLDDSSVLSTQLEFDCNDITCGCACSCDVNIGMSFPGNLTDV